MTPWQKFVKKILNCRQHKFKKNIFEVNYCQFCGANPLQIKYAIEYDAEGRMLEIQDELAKMS